MPYYDWGNVTPRHRSGLAVHSTGGLGRSRSTRQRSSTFAAVPPFALLMRREVWQPIAIQLADRYPRGRIRNVTPDGARVVLEVPS